MALEFKLPELGENIESGDVVNVLVSVGDMVTEGQSLLEIEAGKASMEIPSPTSGAITAVHVADGDTVEVGQLAFTIDSEGAGSEPDAEEEPKPEPESESKPEPEPKAEEPAKEPEPEDKPAKEEPNQKEAPAPKTEPAPAPASAKATADKPAPASKKAVSAAPNVRRLARELGVDIHNVPATTEGGRISLEDVKNFAKSTLSGGGGRASVQGATRTEKMSAIRKATMNHMAHCWSTIPHVTQQDWADITHLDELRKKFAKKAEAEDAKLTVTAILVKVVASALKVFPNFNCSIDPDAAEIIYKDFYNIGIAVDTDKGLMVPVIRDADQKNMIELAKDLGGIAGKAREGQIGLDDLKGGTFTISNLGGIGGTFFTPIINSPEVAILGVGRAVKEGDRLKMPLSLSYDHRIIDGADGARFIRWIADALEEPLLLALEG